MSLWGQAAGLNIYRSFFPGDTHHRLDQLLQEEEAWLLDKWIPCQLNVKTDKIEESSIGFARISSDRLIFCAQAQEAQDIVAPGSEVELHALASEPSSVYIQLARERDDGAPVELTLVPNDSDVCDALFTALTKLVENHPVLGSDEEGDDDMIVAPRVGGEATEEEQEAMLERLDQLLVVPPEYDLLDEMDGQFDDADENIL